MVQNVEFRQHRRARYAAQRGSPARLWFGEACFYSLAQLASPPTTVAQPTTAVLFIIRGQPTCANIAKVCQLECSHPSRMRCNFGSALIGARAP